MTILHPTWDTLMSLFSQIAEKYNGIVHDSRCGERWDPGQAVCAELYGPDWMSHPQVMCERVGNARFNPEIQRIQRDVHDRYDEPEDDYEDDEYEEEECPTCGFDPCRCNEINAVTDALKRRGVKIASNTNTEEEK